MIPGSPRVLMTSQRFFPYTAGAELQALGLARSLTALGADVRFVTTKFARHLAGRETLEGVPVQRLSTLLLDGEGNATGGNLSALAKVSCLATMTLHVAAHARKFDVVHAHCLSASSLGAALGARLAGVPVIVKPSLGGREGELRKIVESRVAPQLLALMRRVDRFAVTDASIGDELLAAGIAPDRLARVSNGVDLDRFRPANAGERESERRRLGLVAGGSVAPGSAVADTAVVAGGSVALFVGQLVERKGVAPLLEAWRSTRERLPHAMLVFAGDGELRPLIEREAAVPGSRIVCLGVRHDVADLMRAADALLLPSRNESFGNVIVEALACGIPVICGNTGVAHALALDGVAGRFVDPDDPASVAAALVDVLGSAERAATLGARGPTLARRFDFRAVAREYLAIYEALREERGRARRG